LYLIGAVFIVGLISGQYVNFQIKAVKYGEEPFNGIGALKIYDTNESSLYNEHEITFANGFVDYKADIDLNAGIHYYDLNIYMNNVWYNIDFGDSDRGYFYIMATDSNIHGGGGTASWDIIEGD